MEIERFLNVAGFLFRRLLQNESRGTQRATDCIIQTGEQFI